MKTFGYSILAKLIYRYANIPVTLVLTFFLISAALNISESKFAILSVLVHIILIYIINRSYLKWYKLFPYTIKANNEKIICTNYFFSSKKIEIKMAEIVEIRGGIFDQKPTAPIYITDLKGQIIGINQHLSNFNKFTTLLLSNVKKELYESILEKLQVKKEKPSKK